MRSCCASLRDRSYDEGKGHFLENIKPKATPRKRASRYWGLDFFLQDPKDLYGIDHSKKLYKIPLYGQF